MSSTVCSVVIPPFFKLALLWSSVVFFLAGVDGANGMVGLMGNRGTHEGWALVPGTQEPFCVASERLKLILSSIYD